MGDWQIVLWSVDPKDYTLEDPLRLAERLDRAAIGPDDVVLLHDTMPATVEGLGKHLATALSRRHDR